MTPPAPAGHPYTEGGTKMCGCKETTPPAPASEAAELVQAWLVGVMGADEKQRPYRIGGHDDLIRRIADVLHAQRQAVWREAAQMEEQHVMASMAGNPGKWPHPMALRDEFQRRSHPAWPPKEAL